MAIVPAADIEKARVFYEDTLGLERVEVSTPGNDLMFESGDGTRLYVYEREAGSKADHTVAGWIVQDVEETVEHLLKKGVAFEHYDMPRLKTDERGVAELGDARAAWFKDPEGNILSITEIPG
jgi:catechol 2,3-dioxygenase-like lactoylglutathione lyase family enzyme